MGTRDQEPNANQRRLRLRLLKHHLPLFAVSALGVFALYVTRPFADVLSRASFATAYPALVALSATLLVGPWNLVPKAPESRFKRPAARPGNLGGDSWHRAFGDWSVRSPAWTAMALLRVRREGETGISIAP